MSATRTPGAQGAGYDPEVGDIVYARAQSLRGTTGYGMVSKVFGRDRIGVHLRTTHGAVGAFLEEVEREANDLTLVIPHHLGSLRVLLTTTPASHRAWCPSCAGTAKSTKSPSGPCETCKGYPEVYRAAYIRGIEDAAAWLRDRAEELLDCPEGKAELHAAVNELEGK